MQITAIRLTNWRGLKRVTLEDLPRTVFFTGLNGSGKTSILNGVQYALTGACYDQEGKKILLRDLVGRHGNRAVVQVDLLSGDNVMTVDVSVTASTSQVQVLHKGKVWLQGRPDEVRETLWSKAGLSLQQANVAANARACLLSDDIGKRLAELGGGLDKKRLEKWCGDHYVWLTGFLTANSLTLDEFDDMKQVGKTAEAERTATNREMKRVTQEIEALSSTEPPTDSEGNVIPPTDRARVQRALDDLGRKRDELLRSIGAAEKMRPAHEKKKELAELRRQLTAETKKTPPASESDVDERLRTAEQQYSGVVFRLSTASDGLARLQKSMDGLRSCDECPTCHRPITEQDRDYIFGPTEREIARLSSERDGLMEEKSRLLSSLEPLRKEKAAFMAATESARQAQARLQARIDALMAEPEQPDIDALKRDVESMDQRIQVGHTKLKALEQQVSIEKLAARRAELYAAVEHLDWAIDAFRDGAAHAGLCVKGRADFVRRANERLEPHGYLLDVEEENANFTVLLGHTDRGVMVPAKFCSDGELLIAQMALAEGFARNIAIGIVDGLDGLDGGQKGQFFDTLLASKGCWLAAGAWGIGDAPEDFTALSSAISPTALVWVDGENTEVKR